MLSDQVKLTSGTRSIRRWSYGFVMATVIVLLALAFLIGLGLGTYTHRPFLTGAFLVASLVAATAGVGMGEGLAAVAGFALVFLPALVLESVRETFALLLGR